VTWWHWPFLGPNEGVRGAPVPIFPISLRRNAPPSPRCGPGPGWQLETQHRSTTLPVAKRWCAHCIREKPRVAQVAYLSQDRTKPFGDFPPFIGLPQPPKPAHIQRSDVPAVRESQAPGRTFVVAFRNEYSRRCHLRDQKSQSRVRIAPRSGEDHRDGQQRTPVLSHTRRCVRLYPVGVSIACEGFGGV